MATVSPGHSVERSAWPVRLGYAAVIVAIAMTGVFWAILTPPARSVDEPVHVNSVIRLMQGGGWPAPRSAPVLAATGLATVEAGRPWMDRTWDDMPAIAAPPAAADRSVVGHLDRPLTHDGQILVDWMTQHPPTWYAIAASAMTVLGADDWRWDQLYFGIRMVSIAFVTGAAAFVLAAIRRLTGSPAAAMLGTLAVFTSAQFFNVLSMATNDSLAIFAGAGFLFFLTRALTPATPDWPARWADTAGAAVLLGLGLLTKGTLLTAIPVVFFALLVAGIRAGGSWWRRMLPAAVSMLIAFAVGGWYYFRNLLVYGEIQSSNSGTGRAADPFDDYSLLHYLRTAATRIGTSFWESTRPYLDLPGWAVASLLAMAALALVVVLVRRTRLSLVLAVLTIYPLCVIGLIAFHGWEVYWNDGRLVGLQGRYLFPAITIYCALFGLAWHTAVHRSGAWVRAVSAGLLGAVFVAAGVLGAVVDFAYRWGRESADVPSAWEAMAGSGAVSPAAALTIAVLAAAAAAVAVAMSTLAAARSARPRREAALGSLPA